jgi:hypothetical protein
VEPGLFSIFHDECRFHIEDSKLNQTVTGKFL